MSLSYELKLRRTQPESMSAMLMFFMAASASVSTSTI